MSSVHSNLQKGAALIAPLRCGWTSGMVVVMVAMGVEATACHKSPDAAAVELTHVPADLPSLVRSNCTSYPCSFKGQGLTWKAKAVFTQDAFARHTRASYPLPPTRSVSFMQEVWTVNLVPAGTPPTRDSPSVDVPIASPEDLLTAISTDVPCPEKASNCSALGVIHKGELVASVYSMCYVPKASKDTPYIVTSVKNNALDYVVAEQEGRAPSLDHTLTIPLNMPLGGWHGAGTSHVHVDQTHLLAFSYGLAAPDDSPSLEGCANTTAMHLSDLSRGVFAHYQQIVSGDERNKTQTARELDSFAAPGAGR